MCIQALMPTCVPDACADCTSDQECRNISGRYFCGLRGDYQCSSDLPCPPGQICRTSMFCARRRRQTGRVSDLTDPLCATSSVCEFDDDTTVPTRKPTTTTPAPPTGQPVVPVSELCHDVICQPGLVCRPVLACDMCEPVAHCVDMSQTDADVDKLCRGNRYLTAVLVDQPMSDEYKTKQCAVGFFTDDMCPTGSVCMESDTGFGDCCTGKPELKPGTCPVIEPGTVGVCGGTFCNMDVDCPGDEKCCSSACGGQMCTAIDLGCGRCPTGFRCVQRPVECPPGRMCIQALMPTCVPDACADCRTDQECRNVTNTSPCRPGADCPEFRYFCGLKSDIQCSSDLPCPRGQSCESVQLCEDSRPADSGRHKRHSQQTGGNTDPYCTTNTYCVDTPETTTPRSVARPGVCPVSRRPGRCIARRQCTNDASCPGDRKCCENDCGGAQCVQPLSDVTTPGPREDQCGGCPSGQKCEYTGKICVKSPCPTWECVPDCGGQCTDEQQCKLLSTVCPRGSMTCDPVPVCVDKPCSRRCPADQTCELREVCSFWRVCRHRQRCVPSTTAPCPRGCRQGQVCQWAIRKCDDFFCMFRSPEFDPVCIDKPMAGSCPAPRPWSFTCYWRQLFLSNQCIHDTECSRGHKCCESTCGVRQCTQMQ